MSCQSTSTHPVHREEEVNKWQGYSGEEVNNWQSYSGEVNCANVFASKDACFKCGAEKSSCGGRRGKLSLAGGESSESQSAQVARSSRMDAELSSNARDIFR